MHIEFSSKDLETSEKFYGDLFGWKIQHMPEMNYGMFETGDGVGGGLSPVSESNPPGTVVVYINTDDIEATLARVEALGGKTMATKTEIPGMGWFGLFTEMPGGG